MTRLTKSSFIALLILLICTHYDEAARILGFFPSPSKSNLVIHAAIVHTLAEAGHDVTVLAGMPEMHQGSKYKFVDIGNGSWDANLLKNMVNDRRSSYKRFTDLTEHMSKASNMSLMHPNTQAFLRTHGPGSFDLIIIGYFLNDFHLGLAAHFQCPLVITFTGRSIKLLDLLVGNPAELAYVPTVFSGLQQPMDFRARVKNFLLSLLTTYVRHPMMQRRMDRFYNYHFPSDRYPTLDEMRKNVSLVFTNHHFSQGPIRPNVPAMVEIGGIQIKDKPDPLPADLLETMEQSKNGVIYFSLGSNVDGALLTAEKAKIMFDVLSELPYTVLWKWGDSAYPGTSPNIIYKSWLPQDDILAHANVKLFITHGGQGSVVESQYHGVPMVGIPLFGDQPANMANVVENGFGLSVSYADFNADSFRSAIAEVLNNPQYSEAVKRFSRLYRDRPLTARQSVVFWTEYVLRHNGAKHMQSPAVHLNNWQLMSLDVIAFLAAVVGVVVLIVSVLCRWLCRLCRRALGKKHAKTDNKSKKSK